MFIVSILRLIFFFFLFLILINLIRFFIFLIRQMLHGKGGTQQKTNRPGKGGRNGQPKTIELDEDQYHVD
ncbi:MAG: hypothetical protein ACOCWH_07020 [Spirochaetota bacterium]